MPYAADGQIAQNPIEGGIEITEQQYAEAIEGMTEGKFLVVYPEFALRSFLSIEVHGFTQDGMIDATIDGARLTVPDDPSDRYRQMVAEWEAEGNTIPAYVPPEPTPLTKLYKSTFIRRMSPSEATVMEQVLQDEDAWLRMLYHSIEYFLMDDALIMYLHMTLSGAFGESRADELLEPEL